jgi:hypothetical protein
MENSIFTKIRKFKIPKTFKHFFNLFSGILLSACCFFVSYLTFKNGWTDLSKVDKFEGIITEKGITTHETSTSGRKRITLSKQTFYLKLQGLNQILAVYNPRENYNHLDNSLHINDTIKVFYNHSSLVDKLNLETFQIEKNNKKILNRDDFQGRERIAFYIGFIGGILLLYMVYFQNKEYNRLNK